MYTKGWILFVVSISLWQMAKGFVIKEEEPVTVVMPSKNVAFKPVSTVVNNTSSFSEAVLDEEENLPVQQNKSFNFMNHTNKLDAKIGEEPVSSSLSLGSEEIQSPIHFDEKIDDIKPPGKDEEKEKYQQVHSFSNESDEEEPKPRDDHHFRHEEHGYEEKDEIGEKHGDDDDRDDE